MPTITLYGMPASVYLRAVRLVLEEKGLAYALEPVDPFAPAGLPDGYRALQPFGKVPALDWDGFRLFESDAIARFIEAEVPRPALIPADARPAARMTQMMRIADNEVYPAMVWGVFVETVRQPARGLPPDAATVAAALERSERALGVLAGLAAPDAPFLLGGTPTLADTLLLPMVTYFAMAGEGRAMLGRHRRIADWLAEMHARPSVRATRSPLEDE